MGACCASTSSFTSNLFYIKENRSKAQEQVDINSAVEYALKKTHQREIHTIHELILSAQNLKDLFILREFV